MLKCVCTCHEDPAARRRYCRVIAACLSCRPASMAVLSKLEREARSLEASERERDSAIDELSAELGAANSKPQAARAGPQAWTACYIVENRIALTP